MTGLSAAWREYAVGPASYSVSTPKARYPLRVRRGTSDLSVLAQVFLFEEYSAIPALPDGAVVLDCGANVGYSAIYFLSRFPTCRVIALEPDPGNLTALRENLSPYGNRATVIGAAVWSRCGRLSMLEGGYRDGREWTRQVRETQPGEAGLIEAVDMPALLDRAGSDRISLLKMDIEGAEAVIFAEPTDAWLPRIDTLAIELHDDSQFGPATPIFEQAIRAARFHVVRTGEVTVCQRLDA